VNLIYRFRWLVYAQVLLGIVAFCMAERNTALLLVAGALGALSWYVVEGPTGRPLPQWTIMCGALASVGWLLVELSRNRGDIVQAMGHFTMWLQVLLLYGKKSNREYGMILVMSLLQMIAASVLSVSLLYGVLLAAYCVLALFTILLFQLKITSDLVMESNQTAAPKGVTVARPAAVTGRGYRLHFRAVTLAVGVACGALAVGVFLLIPRSGQSHINPSWVNPFEQRQAGFSPRVELSGAPFGSSSREPVAHIRLSMGDQPIAGEGKSWLLRGAALDRYDPISNAWSRGPRAASRDVALALGPEGRVFSPLPFGPEAVDASPVIEADITLRGQVQRTLFTLYPPSWLQTSAIKGVSFNPVDQQLAAQDAVLGALNYRVRSPLSPPDGFFARYKELAPEVRMPMPMSRRPFEEEYARGWRVHADAIRELAHRILAAKGLERDPAAAPGEHDEACAAALEDYLRTNFTYSLKPHVPAEGEDPIWAFLAKERRGHCELFASGMTALARSLGMRARVVTGYRVYEFNAIGGYYVVRQSNAHAWTEIDCGPRGWRVFDSTPPDDVAEEHEPKRGWLSALRDLYEHLEFTWVRTVVAYDQGTRDEVLNSINRSVDKASAEPGWFGKSLAWVRDFVNNWEFDTLNTTIICTILFFILVGIVSLIRTLVTRRRRLVALQLTALPRAQRRSLVKQLRFYLTMLDMLERYGHIRPAWQSPASFAHELAEAHPLRFDPVVALTELFYEIRFGYRQVDEPRQKRIDAHLQQLAYALAQRKG
jgi:transglutaminase-like putative cysteine protease